MNYLKGLLITAKDSIIKRGSRLELIGPNLTVVGKSKEVSQIITTPTVFPSKRMKAFQVNNVIPHKKKQTDSIVYLELHIKKV